MAAQKSVGFLGEVNLNDIGARILLFFAPICDAPFCFMVPTNGRVEHRSSLADGEADRRVQFGQSGLTARHVQFAQVAQQVTHIVNMVPLVQTHVSHSGRQRSSQNGLQQTSGRNLDHHRVLRHLLNRLVEQHRRQQIVHVVRRRAVLSQRDVI